MKGVAYGREQAEHHPGTPPGLRDRDPHGNTVLVVSGFFKKDTTDTAADKMMKVLEAEAAAGHKAQLST